MAGNAPKFASFRAKPKEPSPPPEKSKRPEEAERQHHTASNLIAPAPSRAPPKQQATPYFVDRKGDPANLKYGLSRYQTPPYRRYGYGYVLGLPSNVKIDRDRSTDRAIVLSTPRSRQHERPLTSKHALSGANRSLRFVKADSTLGADSNADFIELPSARKRKQNDDLEPKEADYRSIEPQKQPQDSDLESESGTELDSASPETTQRNAELIRRTREHPQDVQAWLDLADHQEAMLTLGRPSTVLSPSDRLNLADVRISTYEQAIQKIGSDVNSQIKLHIGLLTEASRTWDHQKLEKTWSNTLAKYNANPELRMKHLDFLQSSIRNFGHDSCRRAFLQCLKTFQSRSNAVPHEAFLHVLIRSTSMDKSSGYQEYALATWQALLEYHLMSPEAATRGKSRSDCVQLFGNYWDSEVARIGEADAKGWRNVNVEHDTAPGPVEIPLKDGWLSPIFEEFPHYELEHMEKLKFPGRTLDAAGEDPFHLVFFSDIEEYLHVLPQETPSILILEAFLCFCGMPPLPELGASQHGWWLDPFLQHEPVHAGLYTSESTSFSQTLSTFMGGPSHFQMTLELLIDHGFPAIAPTDSINPAQSYRSPAHLQFIRRTLKLLTTNSALAETVGEYLLAFEFNYFPDESFKTAKHLLKALPTSTRLYNAYGLVESRRGNSGKADQVYSAALSMQKSTIPFTTPGSLQLLTSWVWEALRGGNKVEALWRLVFPRGDVPKDSSTRAERPDQTSLLRVRTALSEANERALLGRDFSSAVLSTSLLAMLAYLSHDQEPSAALVVHAKLSDWFLNHALSNSPGAELHAQSIAQFLTYHASNAPIVKPALLRTSLEPLITLFPNNTILLSLYAANEARFSIDDRVRGIVHQNILANNSIRSTITGWLFAIHYEMQRGEIAGSTQHSVRALFTKAEDDVGAHCPALWTSHVLFELAEAEKEAKKRPPPKKSRREQKASKEKTRLQQCYERVHDTFSMGVTRLPWDKGYMMMAFTVVRDVLSEEERRRVLNVMVEKELRLYVEVSLEERRGWRMDE